MCGGVLSAVLSTVAAAIPMMLTSLLRLPLIIPAKGCGSGVGTGGTITGANPKTSVVNRYLQAWEADNLFVMGASVFPQNASYNPTGPVGAFAYWAADAIKRYVKNPGPLVQA